MKQYEYKVFINNAVAFTVKGDCEAVKATRDFISSQVKASFTVAAKANNKTSNGEEYPTWSGGIEETIKNSVIDALWQSAQVNSPMCKAKVGDKSNSAITVCGIGLSWECVSGRAPARPKHVIAAEKAARAAKSQARAKWEKEAQERMEERIVNLRKRIKHQVDHAFATGKSGTEPASKYITCQHCDAPAAILHLSRKLPLGAAVLDEDTIVGAVCAAHGNWGSGNVERIPCAKLEFFYDGVRQIAIKTTAPAMPSMKQLDEYRKKIVVFTQQLPSTPTLGSVSRMRTFITKMMDGVPPHQMTVAQWEKFFTWLDDFVARHGVKALIACINNALGDL